MIKRTDGYTLIELILTVALSAVFILLASKALTPVERFLSTNHYRQKANTDARVTHDTVRHLLSHARPASLVISSFPGAPPNSTIDFTGEDGTAYEISCLPNETVYFSETPSKAGAQTLTKTIASNVTAFNFSIDTKDPTAVLFKYLSETTLNASGLPESIYSVELNSEIRMEGN